MVSTAGVPARGLARDRPRGHRSPRLSRAGDAAVGTRAAWQQAVGEPVAPEAAAFGGAGAAAAAGGRLQMAAGREPRGQRRQSGRVHDRHQLGECRAGPDQHDHSGRPEAAGHARQRGHARAARAHRPAPDDARLRRPDARTRRQRRRSRHRNERVAVVREAFTSGTSESSSRRRPGKRRSTR